MVIKQEAARRGGSPASPCAGRVGSTVASNSGHTGGRARHQTGISASVNMQSPSHGRQARSGAPSVDTYPMSAFRPVSETAPAVDDDEPIIMQIKPARPKIVKPDPDAAAVDPPEEPRVNGNDSILNRNFQKIASNQKALGEALGELQSLGIQHVASLPSLVLVGDQSSGKSTLMSGIAGLSLPHREGMCTRCPVHIRLSKSDTWRCNISLQQDFSFDGAVGRKQPRLTAGKQFGPWTPQLRVTKEFWSCRDKDDDKIRIAIRWAQIAILNHDTSYRTYIPCYGTGNQPQSQSQSQSQSQFDLVLEEQRLDEAEREAAATFSPNTVALNISGPTLTDLSFYDLPGLIKTPKHEQDQYLVKVVENLAKKHISDEQAIIMWAVPMNADVENSSTLAVIRSQGAQGRTVGIMTKADLLPQSSRTYDQWLAMLRGAQHKVGRGFFITARQPMHEFGGQGIDLYKQNSFEESFFNRQRPTANFMEPPSTGHTDAEAGGLWPKEFEEYSDRCGLNSLVVFLSKTLSRAFVDSLPGILRLVEDQLNEVDSELSMLPGTPDNPYAELRESLMNFTTGVKLSLSRGGDFETAWGRLTDRLRDLVLEMKPKFVVKPPTVDTSRTNRSSQPLNTPGGNASTVINLDNIPEDDTPTLPNASLFSSGGSHRRNHQEFLEGQQDHLGPTTPKKVRAGRVGLKQEDDLSPGSAISQRIPGKSPTLEDVRQRINGHTRRGIPDLTPPAVYEEMSLEAITPWEHPLREFVTSFTQVLDDKMKSLLVHSFQKLMNKAVFRESSEHLDNFIRSHGALLTKSLLKLYRQEKYRMFTMDVETFQRHKAAEEVELKRARHHYRWEAYQKKRGYGDIVLPFKRSTQLSNDERRDEETRMAKERPILGEDPYLPELNVCAYVRGYYLTAAWRFVDSVVLAVVSDLLPTVVEEMSRGMYLEDKLDLMRGGQARIEQLMAEESAIANKRRKLAAEKDKLVKAKGSIMRLEAAGEDHADGGGGAENHVDVYAYANGNANGDANGDVDADAAHADAAGIGVGPDNSQTQSTNPATSRASIAGGGAGGGGGVSRTARARQAFSVRSSHAAFGGAGRPIHVEPSASGIA